jgi:hypothetical protein
VGLVFCQHHGVLGEVTELLVQVGQHLLAVGVALGNQPGPTPGGDLADAAAHGALADGRPAQLLPKPADRPGLGLGEQPQDALAKAGAAQPGSAGSGPVDKPAGAMGVVAVDPAATASSRQP